MTFSTYRLLEFVVDAYDQTGRPLTPTDVAERFGTRPEAAKSEVQRLVDCELVTPEADGYRPTITGRELLELDLDDGFVVVDVESDPSSTH